jgi:anti-sigma factor ChrR (cupin superfamily)
MWTLYRFGEAHTFLLRLDPGAVIPQHLHHGAEECYVLEGELRTWDTVLRAGDFLRSPPGSDHAASRSEGGCLLLLTTAGLEAT